MSSHQLSCIHRGNTFFGAVEVVGDGSVVRVRYNGETREAKLDGLTVDLMAHLLLRELVVADVAACETPRRHGVAR